MKAIDFLFWHYYCFYRQHITGRKLDIVWEAMLALFLTLMLQLGFWAGAVNIFICSIENFVPKYGTLESKLLAIIIGLPLILCLYYRYSKMRSIISEDYKLFRNRWGEPNQVSKKNMRILLAYTLFSTVGLIVVGIIMGTLNKHGYFEGCRLFP